MKLLNPKYYTYYIRIQRWGYFKRKRRQTYRTLARDKDEAVNNVAARFHNKRGLVVTKVSRYEVPNAT